MILEIPEYYRKQHG